MRPGSLLAIAAVLCACGSARALQHTVTDFRQDSSTVAADRYHLDLGWGDSLLLDAQSFRYTSVRTDTLDNTHFGNGDAGASPMAAATANFQFRVFYLAWVGSTHDNKPGATPPPANLQAPRADILSRIVSLSPDTAAINDTALVMASQENHKDTPPIFFYDNNVPPAPYYFNFAAEGANFAAYWSSGAANGPIRRVTHRENNGAYVPPGTPVVTGGYGKVSSAMIPNTGGTKTVLAYETDAFLRKFHVRWEDLSAATSVVSADYPRPVLPEDFAVAADSNGSSLVLWRENADLYAVAFNAAHVETQPPTLIQAGVTYKDSIDPPYRSYAVASLKRDAFMIAYAFESGGICNIVTRTVALPGSGAWAVGAPVALTSNHWNLFPDIAVSNDRAVIGYFQRTVGGSNRRFMGSILNKTGNTVDFNVGRTDLDFANENINFQAIDSRWYYYHWFKAANVAIDGKGNVLGAYDSGPHAKVALVRNTPIYYDTAFFASKVFTVENPAVPAFVFNPATDSVTFQPLQVVSTDSTRSVPRLAVSPDLAFSGGTAYQSLPAPLKAATGFYRYRVDLLTIKTGNPTTTNLTTPKVKTLTLDYNVKPWTPVVDSLRTGTAAQTAYNPAAAYTLLTRKDTLKLVCSGFDADDDGMVFKLSLGNTVLSAVTGTRVSAGNYKATISVLPPDNAGNPLLLSLITVDNEGWSSRRNNLSFVFRNIVPSQTVRILRNRGRDSSLVYRPSGGGVDTLVPVEGGLLYVQTGDSLTVKSRYADANDDTVTAAWLLNSTSLGSTPIPVTDSLRFNFAPDLIAPIIDTLVMRVGDKDTTVTLRVPVRLNRIPTVDSIFHASYKGKDSVWKIGPFDRVKNFAADTGLLIPSGLPTMLQAGVSDPDAGEALTTTWRVWKQPVGCPHGNTACYVQVDSALGTSITRTFDYQAQEQFVTVRVTDPTGAFLERRVWLEYPLLDTSLTGTAGYAAAVQKLYGDIIFTVGASKHDSTIKAQISSKGTADLRISSLATKSNDRKWTDLKVNSSSGDSARFVGATNVNALTGGKVIVLPPGATLDFSFRFFSDSLRGDSTLTDTLLVRTNDFIDSVLKIPFRIFYRDLPVATLSVPGSPRAGPAGGFNAAGLPKLVPAKSSLAVSFSETIRMLNPAKDFRVYSLLDSLKRPAGKGTIAGTYAYRRKAAGLGKTSAAADSLADTVVFTPKYDRVSDSLKVRPNPGYFIHRDILRIQLSNGITDRSGNALDLRLDKTALVPGSMDSAFQVRVDTSYLAIISTDPPQGGKGWDPEKPVRIRFNRKLSRRPPLGTDTLTLFNPAALKAVDNRAVHVTSLYRPGQGYDFRQLTFADNDSSLLIGTRPFLPALDTITLVLSGGILDTSGLSLDGNGDKLPEWLYDQRDSVDRFTLTFTTRDADFYVFPNPFRFSDSRHRDKGSITFKNLNTLRGYAIGDNVVLRIHTMTGDLVFKTSTSAAAAKDLDKRDRTSLDWNLQNDHGNTVGTGVYIYTLMIGDSKVLTKGKVAVVR